MNLSGRIKPWLGRKSVRGVLVIVAIVASVLIFNKNGPGEAEMLETKLPVVTITTPTDYVGGQSLSVIGTVRAFDEARVTSERSGRVVSVNVSLGQQIQAGTVIATLENASERAAVLQAEGLYDAAVASAAQSNVGVDEAATTLRNAENNAVSIFKSSYNTTNEVVRNSIDQFFSDPDAKVPGLRIDGKGEAPVLNSERVAFQTILPAWQTKANTISTDSDLVTELRYAEQSVQRTILMIDTFLNVFSNQNNGSQYTNAEIQSYVSLFTGLRANLIGVQSSIDGALSGLSSANDAVRRAELTASGSQTSVVDAQMKQALGTLRSAQANLSKTILRTPVSGTVNSLSVRTGDFINSFAPVAIVANNTALEIVTYVSDTERKMIAVGDIVLIESKFEGRITEIAPAVDSATRKTEVRIATEGTNIANGDTVRVSKELDAVVLDTKILVPLTAVKFERENGFIFTVSENKLEQKAVKIGSILGGSIEITEGLSTNDEFVIDSRGLIDGEKVEVTE